ncbi:uracil-DNA glycosylase [Methyloligella sp. 2.7D]|uniref:uracil-DNA glycosylase n=1 Tax=unclassified Methyloligella TaxID=2625955 RepID=UPI00157C9CF7|nr:uracil-DNA glycosylase [Methyloligella sp. GL2]QKP77621.1 uracil-DNA glycosylase [Methyloligella sp. GL2]
MTAELAAETYAACGAEPPPDCRICPRLVEFREENRAAHPNWFNHAVPSFGPDDARLLIVGLAPGLKGANRTGFPFMGDFAGDLLYSTLLKFGLATGRHAPETPQALRLVDCMITNAVRCVPPANKPTPKEISACRPFLVERIASLPKLIAILALGRIAHDSTLRAFGLKLKDYPFGHGASHALPGGLHFFDSYHCSRYNTNTGVLTEEMFESVFASIRETLRGS